MPQIMQGRGSQTPKDCVAAVVVDDDRN